MSEIDDNFQGLFLNFVMQSVITAGTLYFAAAKNVRPDYDTSQKYSET